LKIGFFTDNLLLIKIFSSIKGVINLSAKLPDYITSWQLSAISLHNEKGLGITSLPIKVLKDF
jgi:hypothetical protein